MTDYKLGQASCNLARLHVTIVVVDLAQHPGKLIGYLHQLSTKCESRPVLVPSILLHRFCSNHRFSSDKTLTRILLWKASLLTFVKLHHEQVRRDLVYRRHISPELCMPESYTSPAQVLQYYLLWGIYPVEDDLVPEVNSLRNDLIVVLFPFSDRIWYHFGCKYAWKLCAAFCRERRVSNHDCKIWESNALPVSSVVDDGHELLVTRHVLASYLFTVVSAFSTQLDQVAVAVEHM